MEENSSTHPKEATHKQDDTFDNKAQSEQRNDNTRRWDPSEWKIESDFHRVFHKTIPSDLLSMTHLTGLYLKSIEKGVHDEIVLLTNLQRLKIQSRKLPSTIGRLQNLIQLELSDCDITTLPDSIGNLTKLNHLDVSNNKLTILPDSIGNLTNLISLKLCSIVLATLPDSIGNLTNLTHLDASYNRLASLPRSIGNLINLTYLSVSYNRLANLPDSIGNLTNLTYLGASYNQLANLPHSIGNLLKLMQLHMFNDQLTILPDSIGNLTNLMQLYMRNNQLTILPDSIKNLTNLTNLDVSNNQLTVLPDSIGNLTNLTNLDLNNNKLTLLPNVFGKLNNLTNLSFDGNGLTSYLKSSFTISPSRIPQFRKELVIPVKIASKIDDVGLWRHMRLFLVGDSAAGKTSIVRWLKGMQFDENHNSTDSVEVSTADMNEWKDVTFDIKDYVAEFVVQSDNSNTKHETSLQHSYQKQTEMRNTTPKIQISGHIVQLVHTKEFQHPHPLTMYSKPVYKSGQYGCDLCGRFHTDTVYHCNTCGDYDNCSECYMAPQQMQQLPWTFHIWDFGGQEEYYNTHHFFLNSSAFYLLVVDISQPLNLSRLQFWIDSVRYYAPTAPIIIIGTHKDKITEDIAEQQMKKIFDSFESAIHCSSIKYCYAVSCLNDNSLHTQVLLKEVAERHEAFNTPCKLSWMLLFDELRTLKNLTHTNSNDNNSVPYDLTILAVIPFEKALEIATTKCGMNVGTLEENTEELKNALKFFHQLGFFIYLEVPILCDIIFVYPQHLIDALRCVITGTDPFLSKRLEPSEFRAAKIEGRISQATLKKLWKDYPEQFHCSLQILLQHFQLGLPDPSQYDLPKSERDIIIPCLVSNMLDPSFPNAFSCVCEVFGMPPLGFQSRVIVHMMQLVHRESSQCRVQIFTTNTSGARGIVFTLYGVPVRVTVESRKVRIQVNSSEPNTIIVDIFKKVFQEINNVCFYHKNTLERKAIIFFCSNPNCEGNTLCDASASWKELRLQDLICHLCVNPGVPNDSPKVISTAQLVHSPRFFDLMQEDDLRLSKLGRALRYHWKELGEKLGSKYLDLDSLKRVTQYNKDFNPSAEMLRKWQHSSDATAEKLLEIFHRIDNQTAVNILKSFLQDTSTQTMLRNVPQVLKLLHNLKVYLDRQLFDLSWERLASELGYEYDQIVIFNAPAPPPYSPTVELLKDWMVRPQSTVEILLQVLKDMQNQAAVEVIKNHLLQYTASDNNNNH